MAALLPEFAGVTKRYGEDTGIVTYDFVWGSIFLPQPDKYDFFVPPRIGFAVNRIGKDAGLFDMMEMVGLKYDVTEEKEEDNRWFSYDTDNTPTNIYRLQKVALLAVNADKVSEQMKQDREERWRKEDEVTALLAEGISEGSMKIFNLKKYSQVRGYPYYLAVYKESRLHGAYPAGVKGIKSLERMVDKSVGMAHREIRSESIQDLLIQLRQKGIEPAYDDVDFYMVRAPNSYREGIPYRKLLDMGRQASGIKEVKTASGAFSEYPFSQDLSFMTDEDWENLANSRDEKRERNESSFRKHKETCEICQDGFITNSLCIEGWNLLRGRASGLKPGEKGEQL